MLFMSNNRNRNQWYNEGQFFSHCYIRADNSLEGFTRIHRTLEQRTKREVEGTINLTDLRQGSEILDLPCGYGRHSVEFAKRGFNVTGMDFSKEFLKLANERATNENAGVNFIHGDMRNIGEEYSNGFDVVANLSYSFGFFESEEDNLRTMKQFYNVLKSGGKLVLHTDICPEMIGKGYKMRETRTLPPISIKGVDYESAKLEIKEWYDSRNKRMHGIWTIVEENNERIHLPEYSVRIYSRKEFEKLCREAGFEDIKFIGDWKESFDSERHQEMTVVAGR